ncbi:MAG: nuclear transport factor 2 family protein [Terriglobales bacterium]
MMVMFKHRSIRIALLVGLACGLGLAQTKRHATRPAATPSAAKQSSASVERAIQELEMKWLDALVRRDQAAVAEILAPEFHDTTMTGQVRNREQALAAVLDPVLPELQRSFGRMDIHSYDGRFAVVNGIVLVSGNGIAAARVAFTDVFVLRDGKWQAVAAQENLQQKQ